MPKYITHTYTYKNIYTVVCDQVRVMSLRLNGLHHRVRLWLGQLARRGWEVLETRG